MENNSKELLRCLMAKKNFALFVQNDPILYALTEILKGSEFDSKFDFIEVISEILLAYSENQLRLELELGKRYRLQANPAVYIPQDISVEPKRTVEGDYLSADVVREMLANLPQQRGAFPSDMPPWYITPPSQ